MPTGGHFLPWPESSSLASRGPVMGVDLPLLRCVSCLRCKLLAGESGVCSRPLCCQRWSVAGWMGLELEVPPPSLYQNLLLQPGDVWDLSDQCHTVTCLPDGQTLLRSHRVNCDQGLRPSCPNSQSPIRVEETCGCRWTCPCKSFASPDLTELQHFPSFCPWVTGCGELLFQHGEERVGVLYTKVYLLFSSLCHD